MRHCQLWLAALSFAVLAQALVQAQQQMSEEVAALHRAVFEQPPEQQPRVDPSQSLELGLRYLEGRGVDRDEVIACGLFLRASPSSEADRLYQLHCEGRYRTSEELEKVVNASCGTVAPKRVLSHLEPGSWVEIGPDGVFVDRPTGRTRHSLDSPCPRQYMLARHISVSLDNGAAAPPRHFVEFLSWLSGHDKDGVQRALNWMVFEIIGSELEARVYEILVQERGSQWPTPSVPEAYRDGASFAIGPDGEVQWRFDSDPPKIGTIDGLPKASK